MNNRLQIGEKIGDYRIVSFLGAGGMGAVYQGVHTKINRAAAIKVLISGGNDSTFARRFFNEARLQSSLQHPNIATLYDFQEINNRLFIFMEFVDGDCLDTLISQRFFAVEDALKTFESICDAVAFIHANNIVHRDIKPQNIKLTSTGKVKLLDFGIAKDSISQGLTRIGGVIGTPNYLAPEQLSGKPATPRTDIWALGVLFYEMLTATEPFKGNNFGDLHLHITTGKYVEPEALNPAVTPEVSQLVAKCLKKDPAERFQSAEELIAVIRRVLNKYNPQPENNIKNSPGFLSNKPRKISGEINSKSDSRNDFENQEQSEASKSPLTGIAAGAAAAILLLIGVVSIGIWAMNDSNANISNINSSNTNNLRVNPTLPNSTAVNSRTINSATPQNTRAIALATAQSGQNANLPLIKVEVDVTEGVAQVYRGGQFVGKTPFELEGEENETVDLTLKRNGYEDLDARVVILNRRRVNTFTLKRKQ